jgi:hypothetical protein
MRQSRDFETGIKGHRYPASARSLWLMFARDAISSQPLQVSLLPYIGTYLLKSIIHFRLISVLYF